MCPQESPACLPVAELNAVLSVSVLSQETEAQGQNGLQGPSWAWQAWEHPSPLEHVVA